MGYWDNIKTPVTDTKKSSGYWDSVTLPKDQSRANDIFDLQGQGINQIREADKMNSFGSIAKETAKGTVGSLYDIAGGIVLPGATHDELRNPTLLKDTIFSLPKGAFDVAKDVVTHPIKSAQGAVGGAARGISDEVTNIITNLFVPDKDKSATAAQIKETLDKYLTPPESKLTEGFDTAGHAAPYILAGGAAGEVGGTVGGRLAGTTGAKVGGVVGNTTGFLAVGQASMPTDSTLAQRAERATQDLVALGLFAAGSKGFEIAKNRIYEGMKAKVISETPPPKETYFDKIKTPTTPKLNVDPLTTEAKKYKSSEEFVKAQAKLFHGGTADLQEIKLGKSNFQKTFYMSDNADYAKSYGGSKSSLNEISLDKNANLADMRKPSAELVNQIKDIIESKPTGKMVKLQRPDGSILEIPEVKGGKSSGVYSTTKIIQGIKDGEAMFAELPEVKQALKKLGYDGQITAESKFGSNYGVWNKDVVKTKSQLTDIWNKAQSSSGGIESKISTPAEKQAVKDRISQTSQKVYDEAIKSGLVEDFPELSKVDTMTLKEQTELAREAIAKDRDAAIKAIESTDIPELRKQSIFKELKSQAIREGDVNTIAELMKSNIGTEAGQALKAFDDSLEFGPADPVKAGKSIREARIKDVEAKDKIDVNNVIKEEKAKFKGPKSWEDFIDSITC